MAFLEWEEKYLVHINDVDVQHEHLMELLNRLYDSVVSGGERTTLGEILEEVIQYTVYHFQTEETLFEKYQYPEFAEHKSIHDELTKTVLDLQGKFKEGSATISFEVLDFLRDWLINHTLGSDQKFGPYLIEKGAK